MIENESKKSVSISSILEMVGNLVEVTKMSWKESKRLVIFLFIATLVSSVLMFLSSGANALIVNELTRAVGQKVFTSGLVLAIGVLMLAHTLPNVVSALREYWDKQLYMIMSEKFEIMMIEKRAELDLARHEEPEFQDLSNKIGDQGIFSILNLMEGQYEILFAILSLVTASSILLMIDGKLWVMIIIGEIPLLIAQFRYNQNSWNIYNAQSTVRRKYFHLRNKFNTGTSIFEIQLFQNTKYFIGRIASMIADFNLEHSSNNKKKLTADFIAGLISAFAIFLAVLMVMMNVINGKTSVGTLIFVSGTLFSFQQSFISLFRGLARHYKNSLFVTDIRKMLATKPVIQKPERGIVVCNGRVPKVEFKNVSFAYPGQTKPVLKNVSFTITPGEIVAFVGENGVGKTTLTKLLCRVYDPTEGTILIDGVDIRTINLESWYANLAVLTQDYNTYCLKVGEVIALGRTSKETNRGDVLRAAEFSGANTFIEQFANQYDQQIGKEFGGVNPSKGQQQRIALSIAAYRNPLFTILDEPTAATDSTAEAAIFKKLYENHGKNSGIIISHNYANVVDASRICVMENGSIIEIGSHMELMLKDGTYARLFKLQAGRFQNSTTEIETESETD